MMKITSLYSLLFTCGILIESPSFDPNEVVTIKDRKDRNLNPYMALYMPEQIRDFSVNKNDGKLDWLILDNSYYDNSDIKVSMRAAFRFWYTSLLIVLGKGLLNLP